MNKKYLKRKSYICLILFAVKFNSCGERQDHYQVVEEMFRSIKNHLDAPLQNNRKSKLTLSGALKDEIVKGELKSVHSFPEPEEFKSWKIDGNKYLKKWIVDYDEKRWAQIVIENTFANGPAVREEHKKTNAILFAYFSNGLPQVLGGEGNNFDDVYFIYYAPITTKSGEAKGIDKNGYHLSAYKDADKNGSLNIFIGIKIIDGTLVLLPGSDEQIPELSFTSS